MKDFSSTSRAIRWAVSLFMLITVIELSATDFSYTNTTGTHVWSTTSNWSPAGGPPGTVGVSDTATIPGTATGVINYDSAGNLFDSLTVNTIDPAELTININAPLVLNDGALFGGSTSQSGLDVVVGSSGSITSLYSMTMKGGTFVVEDGGEVMVNKKSAPGSYCSMIGSESTIRGLVKMPGGTTFNGTSLTVLDTGSSLNIDGGSLDTDAVAIGNNCSLLLTENGGLLNTQLTGSGIFMAAGVGSTYLNSLTMLDGVVTNESCFRPGYANTFGGRSNPAQKSYGGISTVNLNGGIFNQRGYTAVGDARIGNMTLDGTDFCSVSDFYVGGGDYADALLPNSNIIISGKVSVVTGSITVTNTPEVQSATSLGSVNGAQFYISSGTELWTGQRIVFTSLSEVTGLTIGKTYYVRMFRYIDYAKCFNVSEYPNGPAVGTYSGSEGSAQWVTKNAILSVGNIATFSDGSRIAPGVLEIIGGTLTVDQLVATNGISSVVDFDKGTLSIQVSSDIDVGSAFEVGNGTDEAILALTGESHVFADGLSINANSVLAVGGTNTIGAANIIGDITFDTDSIIDIDFSSTTNDYLSVVGTVTLSSKGMLVPRDLDLSGRSPILVMQATAISGEPSNWKSDLIEENNYRIVKSGNQLLIEKIKKGTVFLVQ